MKASNALLVVFSLYDYGEGTDNPHPREFYRDVSPAAKAWEWIPQTMMESIWVIYEFASAQDRQKFLGDRPAEFDKANLYEVPQGFIDHWVAGKLDAGQAGMGRLERIQ